jgi:urease accessory protein
VKPFDLDGSALKAAGRSGTQAHIAFACDPAGATFIQRQRVGYPFHLGRALHSSGDPEGMPTVYLQSCSGGLFEGDNLGLEIRAGAGCRAHVTTGASTIVHSMETAPARHRADLEVESGAFLEYLPDPTILFPRARLDSSIRVRLHPGASAIVGDSLLLHDPKGGAGLFEWLRSETRIESAEGRLLACDRFHVGGTAFSRRLPGITGTSAAQGSLFVVGANVAPDLVEALRNAMDLPGSYGGAGLLPNQSGAWTRILAVDAAALRASMFAAWSAARRMLTGTAPQYRRK